MGKQKVHSYHTVGVHFLLPHTVAGDVVLEADDVEATGVEDATTVEIVLKLSGGTFEAGTDAAAKGEASVQNLKRSVKSGK